MEAEVLLSYWYVPAHKICNFPIDGFHSLSVCFYRYSDEDVGVSFYFLLPSSWLRHSHNSTKNRIQMLQFEQTTPTENLLLSCAFTSPVDCRSV